MERSPASDQNPRWPTAIAWNAVAFLVALYTGAGPWYVLIVVWIAGAQLLASTYITNANRRRDAAADLRRRLDMLQGDVDVLNARLAAQQRPIHDDDAAEDEGLRYTADGEAARHPREKW